MVTLNDYLYSGDTMFKILKNYSQDLKKEAKCIRSISLPVHFASF